MTVGLRRCQLRAFAGRLGDITVRAHRGLQYNERPVLAHQREERLVQRAGGGGPESDFDVDAVHAQLLEAFAVHQWIRILDGGDDARDAGLDDPLDAGAGASDVTARLERAVQGRAPRERAGLFERVNLRVRFADAVVETLADDHSVARHHHRADERVGTRAPAPALGQ